MILEKGGISRAANKQMSQFAGKDSDSADYRPGICTFP